MSEALIAFGVDPALISVAGSHKEVAAVIAHEATVDVFIFVFGMDTPAIIEDDRTALRGVHGRA